MRNLPLNLLSSVLFMTFLPTPCVAIPQAPTSSPTPSLPTVPWATKVDAFHDFILQQPDQNASTGFCRGPFLRKTFADDSCLQLILCNWNCNYELPYKMRGVAKWFDSLGLRSQSNPIWDPYRYYVYEHYQDPDDGWDFYGAARLAFGACGNRGPQSSCGVQYCVDENGETVGRAGVCVNGTEPAGCVPKGETPWMDPNDRNRLCSWLRNGTSGVE